MSMFSISDSSNAQMQISCEHPSVRLYLVFFVVVVVVVVVVVFQWADLIFKDVVVP